MSSSNFSRKISSHSKDKSQAFLLWFDELDCNTINQVGNYHVTLAHTWHNLGVLGINMLPGFVTTAYAYTHYLKYSPIESYLRNLLSDQHTIEEFYTKDITFPEEMIPSDLKNAVIEACFYLYSFHEIIDKTQFAYRDNLSTGFILNSYPISGNSSSLLISSCEKKSYHAWGLSNILDVFQRCLSNILLEYIINGQKIEQDENTAISVNFQMLGINQLTSYGKLSSFEPKSRFRNVIYITASDNCDSKTYNSVDNFDQVMIFKPTLKQEFPAIISKKLRQQYQLKQVFIYLTNDTENLLLAKWSYLMEDYFSTLEEHSLLVDAHWLKNKQTGNLFISSICLTEYQHSDDYSLHKYCLQGRSKMLLKGHAIGTMIGQGKVHIISKVEDLSNLQYGEVLVTNRTDPDWRIFMQKASAILTNQGGRTCHSAISAREMNIPCIVGCGTATADLYTGQYITVCCAEGDEGKVYEGILPFEKREIAISSLPKTRTQILINIGNPEVAFDLASLPCDGVGVARSEFIIVNEVKVHPLALIHFDMLPPDIQEEIEILTKEYANKQDYFIDKMFQGIGKIAAAFYPKPVIVRMSDFKSNEYANLLGGKQFEPDEENPMIGWRGASRYYDKKYRLAYHLECQAIKHLRNVIGLTNIIPLIPFCRTPTEGRKVLEEMASQGLTRGENGLKVYIMCEIPSNVILAEEFSKIFDGFSIGSNDLTQLILGVDRDSEHIDHIFDERDEAVKEMIRQVVQKAKKNNRKVGICGQAPSDYPDFIPFLINLGIDSISLSPDSVIQTRLDVFDAEQQNRIS